MLVCVLCGSDCMRICGYDEVCVCVVVVVVYMLCCSYVYVVYYDHTLVYVL